jgi:hypothetical protein
MAETVSVRRLFTALALTALLGGCGHGSGPEPLAGVQGERSVSGATEASCAAFLDFQGHRYVGYGDLLRDPATTGLLDAGSLPGCDDGNGAAPTRRVRVAELVDVPLRRAVLVDGVLYVRTDRALPQPARKWFVAPACQTGGQFSLRGDWLSVQGPRELRFDGDIRPPYRLGVHVTRGPEKYLGTTLQVHATSHTYPTLGATDVKHSLWKGGGLIALVQCAHGDFLASSLTSTPG